MEIVIVQMTIPNVPQIFPDFYAWCMEREIGINSID